MSETSNAPAAVDAKPVAPAPAAIKAAEPTVATKRKPGRPAGSKTVKAVAHKPPVSAKPAAAAKLAAAKPAATVKPAAKVKPAAARPAATAKTVSTKPIKTTTKPVAPLAAATSEGSRTMNDTIATMQDSAKTFTGEATARAKGAYQKGIKMTEDMTEFQKGNVEAIVESSKLAAKAVETLGQGAADYARKSFESGTTAFKSFASAKSPTELFKLQSDYAKTYFDSLVAESSKVTEAWLKIAGEIAQPLSNRVAVAVDKVKATAAF